jgi:hypothetical protein
MMCPVSLTGVPIVPSESKWSFGLPHCPSMLVLDPIHLIVWNQGLRKLEIIFNVDL